MSLDDDEIDSKNKMDEETTQRTKCKHLWYACHSFSYPNKLYMNESANRMFFYSLGALLGKDTFGSNTFKMGIGLDVFFENVYSIAVECRNMRRARLKTKAEDEVSLLKAADPSLKSGLLVQFTSSNSSVSKGSTTVDPKEPKPGTVTSTAATSLAAATAIATNSSSAVKLDQS